MDGLRLVKISVNLIHKCSLLATSQETTCFDLRRAPSSTFFPSQVMHWFSKRQVSLSQFDCERMSEAEDWKREDSLLLGRWKRLQNQIPLHSSPQKMNHDPESAAVSRSILPLKLPPPPRSLNAVSQAAVTRRPVAQPLSLTSTHSRRHYHAFISSPAACHGQPPLGPPGYFTNNLVLISHRAPLPVIKEPINGAGKGEAFK